MYISINEMIKWMSIIIHIIEKLRWNLLMLKNPYIDFKNEVNDKDPKLM